MKMKLWTLLILSSLTAANLFASGSKTNSAAAKSAAAAPKLKPKPASADKHTLFDPPLAGTVKDNVVNLRGQPNFVGEVITHMKKGESVSILEEIVLHKPTKDEPGTWLKIAMPTNTPVWISASLVDGTNGVTLKKANVRGGPGENYSSIVILAKGAPVKVIRSKSGWLEIETPAGAVAYVASECIDRKAPEAAAPAPGPAVTPLPVRPPESVSVPPNLPAPVIAADPTPAPVAEPPVPAAVTPPPVVVPPPTVAIPAPEPETAKVELTKRVITREGVVKKALNIQAPSDYELHDFRTGKLIDYLQSPKDGPVLKKYVGVHVLVSGEEVIDRRWKSTPMLQIQSLNLP